MALGEVRVSLDYSRSRDPGPLAEAASRPQGSHTTPGPHSLRTAWVTVTMHGHSARQSCAVTRVAPRISIPHSNPSLADSVWFVQAAVDSGSGVGARHGWPVRKIAQQRTNSFRASATIAFFLDNPLACSRSQVSRAQRL